MAYVLGVIYTDGCLDKPMAPVKFRVTIGQKEPELSGESAGSSHGK